MYSYKKMLLVFSALLAVYVNQPTPTYASGSLSVNEGRHARYTEVSVDSGGRYYYDRGVFYTGQPGHYVVTEAPVGAVVYNVPSAYERVEVDGVPYIRYRDVYYTHVDHGYRVVPRPRGHDHERQGQNWHEHQDEHHRD